VFTADPGGRTLCVVDDGSGMTRGELRRYHDLATSGKTRGRGIGFQSRGGLSFIRCERGSRSNSATRSPRWVSGIPPCHR
jgi:hypothetical protein